MNEEVSGNAEEIIRSENARLRSHLGAQCDHGRSLISPAVENVILKRILNSLKFDRRPDRISIRAYLGFPRFIAPDKLKPLDTYNELDRMLTILKRHGILLSVCDDTYSPDELYRFIVEELFFEEIDDIHINGIWHTFVYEDFYPNHEFDLKRLTEEFLVSVLTRSWDPVLSFQLFSDSISIGDTTYGLNGINALILNFQAQGERSRLEAFVIYRTEIDTESKRASVSACVRYVVSTGNEYTVVEGDCELNFVCEFGCWFISGVSLTGLNPA